MPDIILASQSPRRKELLEQIGLTFSIIPAVGEEKINGVDPVRIVQELAAAKAEEVAAGVDREVLVIGADTVVVCDGRILGKPRDRQDAHQMLCQLQGRSHSVYTGVCLLAKQTAGDCREVFAEETKVRFYPMSSEDIAAYIDTGEPMDKAGAYGIQGRAAVYIERIEGDYNNVVGLPAARIYQLMKQKGWLDDEHAL